MRLIARACGEKAVQREKGAERKRKRKKERACVRMCVCVRERERERGRGGGERERKRVGECVSIEIHKGMFSRETQTLPFNQVLSQRQDIGQYARAGLPKKDDRWGALEGTG